MIGSGRRLWGGLAAGLAGLLVLAYLLAAGWMSAIDDESGVEPGPVAAGESRAVAMAARLVFREVDDHPWVANDPFFTPGWLLDDMPNFQQGVVGAVATWTEALDRVVGSDPELARAAGLLRYPGTVWKFDPRTSWAPTASAEKQYRAGARNLVIFNERLAVGDATFGRDAKALARLLDAIGADLEAVADSLDSHMGEGHWALFDTRADDAFYRAKGRVYAASVLVRELGWDFADTLAKAGLSSQWAAMMDALRAAAALKPLVVIGGAPDGLLLPSHLAAQGFLTLRARARLAVLVARLA